MDTQRKKKRSTIQIDGDKLRSLLESTTGKTIYDISIENGFSRNLISEACRSGYASAIVQNVTKLYGISPEAYKIVETEDKEPVQMTIDEVATVGSLTKEDISEAFESAIKKTMPQTGDFIKEIIKGAFEEALFKCVEDNVEYMVAEYSKSVKGNVRKAIIEALAAYGWTMKK